MPLQQGAGYAQLLMDEVNKAELASVPFGDAEIHGRLVIPGVDYFEDSVAFLGVKVPIGKGGLRVPKIERFEEHIFTLHDICLLQNIAVALTLRQPVLYEGGSGIGKSDAVDLICALTDWESYYVNCRNYTIEDLIGCKTIDDDSKVVWVHGLVIQAAKSGGVLFLDEYNSLRGEVRSGLHEVLDAILRGTGIIILTENGGEVVPVSDDLRIVAAQNSPGGDTLDKYVLDKPQFTRFVYQRLPDALPEDVHLARALGRIGHMPEFNIPEDLWLHENGGTELSEIRGIETLTRQYVSIAREIEKLTTERNLAGRGVLQPVYFSAQRDMDRVFAFVQRFCNGNGTDIFRKAMDYYYVNRFGKPEDREKAEELVQHIYYIDTSVSKRLSLESLGREEQEEAQLFPRDGTSVWEPDFEEYGIGFLESLKWGDGGELERVRFLGGCESDPAYRLREKALEEGYLEIVAASLMGCDSPHGDEMRRELLERKAGVGDIALSLTGCQSEESWAMRQVLLSSRQAWVPLAGSITGCDSPEADAFRRSLLNAGGNILEEIAEGLATCESARDLELREVLRVERTHPGHILEGLAGCVSEGSIAYRQELVNNYDVSWIYFIWSLKGCEFPASLEWRRTACPSPKAKNKKVAPEDILQSLNGCDSEETLLMRDAMMARFFPLRDHYARSLKGCSSQAAREKRAELRRKKVGSETLAQGVFSPGGSWGVTDFIVAAKAHQRRRRAGENV